MVIQYLLADVGGTNTRVALAHDGELQTESIKSYNNSDQSGIDAILQNYLQECQPNADPSAVCVDVAGPVDQNQGKLTNLDWVVTAAQLCSASGAQFGAVLNDMQAQGLALSHLPPTAVSAVLKGTANTGSRLVVNVGTGFNSALVLEDGQKPIVPISETGHVDLPTPNFPLFELHQYLTKHNGFASVEEVLSGRGLGQIYSFLAAQNAKNMTANSKVILENLETDPIACEALTIFLEVFGCVCGNLALTHLPYGGIYLVGGMARAMADHYGNTSFQKAFATKGRFSDFMSQFSVHLVEDDHAALVGCISYLEGCNIRSR